MNKKNKNRLPKILLHTILVLIISFAFIGCFDFGGGDEEKSIKVVYHTNGGDSTWGYNPDSDGNIVINYSGKDTTGGIGLMLPYKSTWVFDGWFLEADFITEYKPSMNKIPESDCDGRELHLYAKWDDKIIITAQNFETYFNFSKNWNGGLNTTNASVNWSIKPKTTDGYSSGRQYVFDPARSDVIQLEMHSNGNVIDLSLDANEYYEYQGSAYGFSAGQTVGGALSSVYYIFPEESFELYLLHEVPFIVTLEIDEAIIVGDTELEYLGTDLLSYDSLPVPDKDGYRFMGWTSTDHIDGKAIIKDTTVFAEFKKEHRLSYKYNGADLSPSIIILDGDKFILPIINKEGYAFLGWYYDADLTQLMEYDGMSYNDEFIYPDVNIHEDTVLFARYEKIHRVDFETKGGSSKESMEFANSTTPDFGKIPSKSGLYFGGWYLDSDCKTIYTEQPITENLTLYALWLQSMTINNIEDYFDVELTVEEIQYQKPGFQPAPALKATIKISLKEAYRNNFFSFYISSPGTSVNWHKEHDGQCSDNNNDSTFLGNFLLSASFGNCKISHLLEGTMISLSDNPIYEFVYEKIEADSYNVISNADHIYIPNLSGATIYVPEA